jgi:DNA-binding transcriptional regulator YhcF (GntR family)
MIKRVLLPGNRIFANLTSVPKYFVDNSLDSRGIQQPAYRLIANGLRDQILSGKLLPGAKLPSERELLTTSQASIFTIHTALRVLIKEGWVETIRGRGNYVAQPKDRFVCAGIYHGEDICSEKQTAFIRRVHVALLERFRRSKKDTLVFIDTRSRKKQGTILPALEEAIVNRRIQCLIFPVANEFNFSSLNRLPLPIATLTYTSKKKVDFDQENLFREGVRRLASEGCRSVSLLSSVHRGDWLTDEPYRLFKRAARDEGLITHEKWMPRPAGPLSNLELEFHGYTQFKKMWKLRDKPDGLLVWPDTVARGVVTGVLETGLNSVIQQMKFVFHRNAHLGFICPFPVTWAISDEDKLAEGLIQLIQKQFEGGRASPMLFPYEFKRNRRV